MDDRQHRINTGENFPHSYPPVEEAWKNMLSILDNKMPVPANSGYTSGELKWWKTVLMGLFFVGCYLTIGDEVRSKKSTFTSSAGHLENSRQEIAGISDLMSISEHETVSTKGNKDVTEQIFIKKIGTKNVLIGIEDDALKSARSEDSTDSITAFIDHHIAESIDSSNNIRKYPKTDSMAEKNTGQSISEENPEEDKWIIQGGLVWELQVPTNGTTGYFDGPNTSSQPWRSLIPGIYFQAMQKKNLLTLELNPMFSNMVPDKPFTTVTNTQISGDSTVTNTEVRALYKMFGLSLGINYMKNISGNWWIGGTFQTTYWHQSIAKSDVEQEVKLPSSIDYNYYSYQYKIMDEWERFNKFQIFMYGDVLYRKEKWQAGIRTGFGVTPVANGEGVKNPFRLSAFYRWHLFPGLKKN